MPEQPARSLSRELDGSFRPQPDINADDHELMRNYHRPQDEKRMVVMLPSGGVGDWLTAAAGESMSFMRQYPAERLQASP